MMKHVISKDNERNVTTQSTGTETTKRPGNREIRTNKKDVMSFRIAKSKSNFNENYKETRSEIYVNLPDSDFRRHVSCTFWVSSSEVRKLKTRIKHGLA